MNPIDFSSQQFFLYMYPVIIAFPIALGLGSYAWRQKKVPGASAFAMLMFLVAFWLLAAGMMEITSTSESALFWYKIRFISIASVPVVFLIFILRFTRHDSWLKRPRILALFILPLVTQLIIWIDFPFFMTQVTFQQDGGLLLVANDVEGPWFNFHMIYSQLATAGGIVLLLIASFQSDRLYRRQALTILLGSTPPILVSSLLAIISPSYTHLSPLSFLLTGVILSWSLFRYGLLDLLPVAQQTLLNMMADGLLVMDDQQRILLINPAAEALLSVRADRVIGKQNSEALKHHPVILDHFLNVPSGEVNFEIKKGDTTRYYDVRITPIELMGKYAGRLVTFKDVSEMINTMRLMEEQYREIQTLQSELKEAAIRDPLTQLFNRRYLEEFLNQELARAKRGHYPVSIVMIDIDRFKKVNDTYGHGVGDWVLQYLAAQLVRQTRRSDLVCRYGGEEFLMVLPGSTCESAYPRAEIWRKTFSSTEIKFKEIVLSASISLGIAAYPADGETFAEVISHADEALYRAKANGRNRAEIYLGENQPAGAAPAAEDNPASSPSVPPSQG